MNSDGQMQVHRVQVANAPLGPPAEEQQPAGAVTLLHRRLRGRYPLAIGLAMVFGAIGVFAGYLATVPQYTAEALVQIQPTLPRVMYKTEENEMPPLFESFVAAQATKLQSSRVLSAAVEDPNMREINWPLGGAGISKLKRSVSVDYRRGTQIIPVRATTDNAVDSARAANAVVKAYQTRDVAGDQQAATDRETILSKYQQDLQNRLLGINSSIISFGDLYGTDDMNQIYSARMSELISIDENISQVNAHIATLEATAPEDDPAAAGEVDLSLDHLISLDPPLADLVSKRDTLNMEIERFGPKHLQTRKLQEDLRGIESRIDSRTDLVRTWLNDGSLTPHSTTNVSQDMSLSQAKNLLERLNENRKATLGEMKTIGTRQGQINAKKEEANGVRASLEETTRKLEQIAVEKQYSEQGRINPIPAEVPTQPSKDRRFQLAVLGGMAGAGFGVGLVLLIGLLKPSYRYLDEIEEAESLVPVLGTLPDLNSKDEDLESLASLSVHHLRNMLSMQARPRKQGGTAFMVTSARPGDGKTSLTVALGMSFAAQGVTVLMIDADLVGHGLTPTMRMDGKPGLRQVAGHGSLSDFIYASSVANLTVLPAGQSSRNGKRSEDTTTQNGSVEAEQLSAERMTEILDDARSRFDVILIDTGPLMGSLEANVVAGVADRVVLTVPRGQDPRLLRAALGRLRSVGATCGGLVFNRATASDLRSSMSTVSFHSQSMRAGGETGTEASAESRHALVRAILMSGSPTDSKANGTPK